jgi:predicted PurR-regulated permease PerM
VHVAFAQHDVLPAVQLDLRSSGSNSTRSPATIDRTWGPTPTAVAQASRRPTVAVAGITMPAAERRSPSAESSWTSTRSCRSWIGRPDSSLAIGAGRPDVLRASGSSKRDGAAVTIRRYRAPSPFPAPGRIPGIAGAGYPRATTVEHKEVALARFEQVRDNIRCAYTTMRTPRELPAPEIDNEPLTVEVVAVPTPASPQSVTSRDDADVPHGLRVAAAWSWRLLILAAAAAIMLWLVGRLKGVLIPVSIALLLSTLLSPWVTWLRQRARIPRSVAVALVLVGGIGVVGGVLTLVVTQFVNSFPDLAENATQGIRTIQDSLRNGPLKLSNDQLNGIAEQLQVWLDTHRDVLTSGALTTATTALDVFASAALVLFATFFLLRDGRRIWRFVVSLLPVGARPALNAAGQASWVTLVSYVRATILVAFIDAVGIGMALVALQIPLAFPLAALVFLGAFIPIIGAAVSGTVAVLVALVTAGWVKALLVLAAVIFVQQVEGHVLQPFIMGRAVAIHPLAVILAITTGLILAGIMGALVAVPLVAVLNTGIRRLAHHRHEPPPDAVVVASSSPSG